MAAYQMPWFTFIKTAQLKHCFRSLNLLFRVERERLVCWSLLMWATSLEFHKMPVVRVAWYTALYCICTFEVLGVVSEANFLLTYMHIGGWQTCLICVGLYFCTNCKSRSQVETHFAVFEHCFCIFIHAFMCLFLWIWWNLLNSCGENRAEQQKYCVQAFRTKGKQQGGII